MKRLVVLTTGTILFGAVMMSHAQASLVALSTGNLNYILYPAGGGASSTGKTVEVPLDGAWAPNGKAGVGAKWISYAQTGQGGFSPPNGTTVGITSRFETGSGGLLTGSLYVDDTVRVLLDGVLLNTTRSYQPAWQDGHDGNYFANLTAGLHELQLLYTQTAGGPSGIQFRFDATSVVLPIPGAAPLAGSALVGLAGLGWLKRRKAVA